MSNSNTLSTISTLLQSADATALLPHLESFELDCACENKSYPHLTAHLLCLIITNDLTEARYLWRRQPHPPPSLQAWTATQALLKSDWRGAHTALNATWPTEVSPLANLAAATVRTRALEAVCSAYSSIRMARLAEMLGKDGEELEAALGKLRWEREGDVVKVPKEHKELQGVGLELQELTEQLIRMQTCLH